MTFREGYWGICSAALAMMHLTREIPSLCTPLPNDVERISDLIVNCSAGAFSLAYNDGGPVMVWSNWVLASVMNIAVALGLAEIVSAMPVAGGPYYW